MRATDIRFLDKKETYALMLSAIYASEVDENYRLLADIMYLLDTETFKSFLTLFEGQTIKIPSKQQLAEMLKALTIYTYRDIHGLEWDKIAEMLGEVNIPSKPYRGSLAYKKLLQALKEKKLNIGGIFDEFPSKLSDIN